MANRGGICEDGGFEKYLENSKTKKWNRYHNNRTLLEALKELRKNLQPIMQEAERGAMAADIRIQYEEIEKELQELKQSGNIEKFQHEIEEIVTGGQLLYLNNHGEEHIAQVIERAEQIVSKFKGDRLSEFEVFILMCAIQIHDIGNVLGRKGHERSLIQIFDEHVKDIIPDTPERRVIKNIAMAHGGRSSNGSRDTISPLSNSEDLLGEKIRTRLLAAILRLADELADDSTRKSAGALGLGIVGELSLIFQDYSRVLHTVKLDYNENGDCQIILVFELEIKDLEKVYKLGDEEKYLLDEIYDRTLKMERERRYCQKFMNSEICIHNINVTINIYGEYSVKIDTISYRLEDISYPNEPNGVSIKEIIDSSIRNGKEELEYVHKRGV